MLCKIDGCENQVRFKKDQVCQKHYFRFMRYGTYELTTVGKRKYRLSNPAGYQKLHEPQHPLACKDGYVYEHRFVYYNSGQQVEKCEMCGCSINWDDCHIDHIDNDVTNNNLNNLRAVCRGCNVFRAHDTTTMGSFFIEFNGKTLSAAAWSRQEGVNVCGSTIKRRYLSGMNAYDSIYGKKKTHTSKNSNKGKLKNDYLRGI